MLYIIIVFFISSVCLAEVNKTCGKRKQCLPGVVLPVWSPIENLSVSQIVVRAVIYFFALCYMFLGVSIVAERFLASIEVITSQEREVKLRKITGEPYTILIRLWNETVSNLTLMALGSSAPEILLSVIEIIGNNFEAGELGPGTIVGSAAFNLFIIVAVCIHAVPDDEKRRVKNSRVFWVTIVWSTFAYLWLYLIISVFSPGVIEIWEGVLTFLCFPLTVLSAYFADRYIKLFGKRFIAKRTDLIQGIPRKYYSKANQDAVETHELEPLKTIPFESEIIAYQEERKTYLNLFRKLRKEHPDLSIRELERLVLEQAVQQKPKSRAFYKIQAMRNLTGSRKGPLSENLMRAIGKMGKTERRQEKTKQVVVSFAPDSYICMEGIGSLNIRVKCDRRTLEIPCTVLCDYKTIAGTAKEHEDFIPTCGVLTFNPDQSWQNIEVKIVDNEIYEDDEYFSVYLWNVRAHQSDNESIEVPVCLSGSVLATVLIIDDDHCGAFGFSSEKFKVPESSGMFIAEVIRTRGARGDVSIPYKTVDGVAKANKDYIPRSGIIYFHDGQTKAQIQIEIINDDDYEKSEDFYLELGEPVWHIETIFVKEMDKGRPVLSQHSRCKIVITEDREFKNFVDKVLVNANLSLMVGTHSWKQQFSDAIQSSDVERSNIIQKILWYLVLPWKLIFATIPPTDYLSGWLCFFVSIVIIGILTAIIGDLATYFGCTIGLKDSLTAVSLVAMGTSIPDLFASRTAAIQDKSADSSIVNVTGSNAVNVFLGLGLAWMIASIYHWKKGSQFTVAAGNLAFSVTLFLSGSIICVLVLQYRRFSHIGAELGGPKLIKIASAIIFIFVWIIYIILSALDAYCFISTF